jgi:hypothetical protein
VFAAIEGAIGDGSSASVSYVGFSLDHHIARKAVSPSLKLLDHLGLIEIEPGERLVNVFRFSNRWRTIDAVEAKRLAELAREVKPHRTFGKPPDASDAVAGRWAVYFSFLISTALAAVSLQTISNRWSMPRPA